MVFYKIEKMKYFTYTFFVLFAFSMKAQVDFDVSILDSIITTTTPQGVYGLSVQEYGGNIHLAYYYGSEEEKWFLIHEVRNQGQLVSLEEVQEFSGNVWEGAHSSIQFDENGNPFIYCSFIANSDTKTIVFSKENYEWSPVDLGYKAVNTYLHSSGVPGQDLGFVTLRKDFEINTNFEIIDYFSYTDGGWSSEIVSTSDYLKTEPAAFHFDGEAYVAYIEAHPPDTTVLFIYKKAGGQWVLDYQEVYPEGGYTFGSIAGHLLWQNIGYFKGEIHLLHNMDKSKVGGLTHVVKSNGNWQEIGFFNQEGVPFGTFAGSEIEFDSKGNLYWADGVDRIHGISSDQEYFQIEGPFNGNYWACLDFEIINDELYMYHVAGNKNFPYGDPVIFYESIGTLVISNEEGMDCSSAIDIQSLFGGGIGEVKRSGVYENTGYPSYHLPQSCDDIFDGLEHVVWFSFTGDGAEYKLSATQCGIDFFDYLEDSQGLIFSGNCNNPNFEACNDDGELGFEFELDIQTVNGQNYYLLLDGYDGEEGSLCLEVTKTRSTSTQDQIFQDLSIFPNPVLNQLQISGFNGDRIELFDVTGKRQRVWNGPMHILDLHDIPRGSYILHFHDSGKHRTKKIVKI